MTEFKYTIDRTDTDTDDMPGTYDVTVELSHGSLNVTYEGKEFETTIEEYERLWTVYNDKLGSGEFQPCYKEYR